MKCFARWAKDDTTGFYFRDQTILQFGDSWDLKANFILLNPSSALPKDENDQTEYLRSKNLPFFIEPQDYEKYVEFSIDRLMVDILELFKSHFDGGTIRFYNLFNLKNQNSGEAIKQFEENKFHPKMFTKNYEIRFCDAPVIVATGKSAYQKNLKTELIRYIRLANQDKLYKLGKIAKNRFSFLKAAPDKTGFIDSYHPSYTFKYGNRTTIGELQINKSLE